MTRQHFSYRCGAWRGRVMKGHRIARLDGPRPFHSRCAASDSLRASRFTPGSSCRNTWTLSNRSDISAWPGLFCSWKPIEDLVVFTHGPRTLETGPSSQLKQRNKDKLRHHGPYEASWNPSIYLSTYLKLTQHFTAFCLLGSKANLPSSSRHEPISNSLTTYAL
jgi:hypothetical protein